MTLPSGFTIGFLKVEQHAKTPAVWVNGHKGTYTSFNLNEPSDVMITEPN